MDMITLRENEEGYDRLKIRPRVLVKVANLDPSTTVFGQRVAFPLGFSPAAMHCMAHPDGELATSRAAAKTGIAMALSNYATTSLEDVAACGSGNPYVMQLSMVKDRSANAETLRRAEAAGYKAVFVTVDCVALGRRLNEFRNNFQLPEHLTFPNIAKTSQTNTFRAETDAMRYGKPAAPGARRVTDVNQRGRCRLDRGGRLAACQHENANLAQRRCVSSQTK